VTVDDDDHLGRAHAEIAAIRREVCCPRRVGAAVPAELDARLDALQVRFRAAIDADLADGEDDEDEERVEREDVDEEED